MFFQSWFDGRPSASSRRLALGGTRPGVLQELMVLDAEGVSRMPSNLTFEEAATLPCAALTAWRALFEEAHLRPGDTVLVQGTGGVSIFALQLAKLAGAAVIVTSSSDDKLERAKTLARTIPSTIARSPIGERLLRNGLAEVWTTSSKSAAGTLCRNPSTRRGWAGRY